MSSIEEFLSTGRVGPLTLDMTPSEVIELLGDADHVSQRANPLLMSYGPIELVFARSGKDKRKFRLIQISITPKTDSQPPESIGKLELDDFFTEQRLHNWLATKRLQPVFAGSSGAISQYVFDSGVTIVYLEGQLDILRIRQRDVLARTLPLSVSEGFVVPIKHVEELLRETRALTKMSLHRPALLVGWSAVEAILRGLSSQHGVVDRQASPYVLSRELLARGIILPQHFEVLERLRRKRMAVAHGDVRVTAQSLDSEELLDLAVELLSILHDGSAFQVR